MAKPLEFTPRSPTPEERLHTELQDATPALEESLVLLRELHEHGVLDVLIKVVRGGEGLAQGSLKMLGSDQMLMGMRTLVELARLLGELHPDAVRRLGSGMSAAVGGGAVSAAQGEKVTPLDLHKMLMDSDVQLALGAVFGLLRGLGRGLREADQQP